MNKADRKQINNVIQEIEEQKAVLEELITSLDERADNTEAFFSDKAEALRTESEAIQSIVDDIENTITDLQAHADGEFAI